ncbi:hypothetical protein GGX14DRAFT_580428 [Mycena pura]|uniref:Uncharacterized protein n=1 Tax=Mycena pura TaxID=153505 RepID=A0AAD6XZC7_9AGAR|nr:hypothetical protein GGX14DRAFT_580428 [Mycena pura]
MSTRQRSRKSTKPATTTRAPRAARVETDAADPPPPIDYPRPMPGIAHDRRDRGDEGDSPSSPINPIGAAPNLAVPPAQTYPAAPPVASTSSRTAIASWRHDVVASHDTAGASPRNQMPMNAPSGASQYFELAPTVYPLRSAPGGEGYYEPENGSHRGRSVPSAHLLDTNEPSVFATPLSRNPEPSVSGMSANAREAWRREKHPALQPSLADTSPQDSPVRPRPMVPPSTSLQAALNAACAALAVGGSSPEDVRRREDTLNRVRAEMGMHNTSPEEVKFADYLCALDAEKQRDEERRALARRAVADSKEQARALERAAASKRAELEEQLQALEHAAAQKHAEAEQLHQALAEQLEIESRRAPSVASRKSKSGNGKVPVNSPEATVPPLKTETQSDWKTCVALQHWREGELADHGESRIPDQGVRWNEQGVPYDARTQTAAAQASTSYANGGINPTQRVSSHSRVKMRYSTVPAPGGDPGGPSDSSDDERGRDPPPPRGPPNLSGHSGRNRRPAGNGQNPGGGGPSDPGGGGDPPGGNPFTWDPNDDTLPRRQDANTAVTSFARRSTSVPAQFDMGECPPI